MDTSTVHQMPSQARLWVYATDRPLAANEIVLIDSALHAFISNWQSHGRPVKAAFDIVHGRFIMISAMIPEAEISGCGIDASVHALERIASDQGFVILSGMHVLYRDTSNDICAVSRSEFRKLVKEGHITGETIVFDTSLTQLEQLKNQQFELPAYHAWHAMVFRIPTTSPQSSA